MAVATDPEEARALLSDGKDVVLVTASADSRDAGGGGGTGRLAVLVGDPSDPAALAAAEEMDRELFGARP